MTIINYSSKKTVMVVCKFIFVKFLSISSHFDLFDKYKRKGQFIGLKQRVKISRLFMLATLSQWREAEAIFVKIILYDSASENIIKANVLDLNKFIVCSSLWSSVISFSRKRCFRRIEFLRKAVVLKNSKSRDEDVTG